MSKVTMQDIADALGTSRVTVWKTFNHRPGVSDEMKEKIIAKAHELGYDKLPSEPHFTEVPKAKTVSLVVSRPDSSIFWTNITVWHRNFLYPTSISCTLMFQPHALLNTNCQMC